MWQNYEEITDIGLKNMYENIKAHIRDIKDFPKEGIVFKDITPALGDEKCFREIIDAFAARFKDKKIDKIAVIESRGFLLGAPLAYKLGCGLVLLRKPGKLPYDSIKESYDLEYGSAALEIHTDAVKKGERVLVIDDLLATGGTAVAACKLINKLGAEIVAASFLVELGFCSGRAKLEPYAQVETFLQY